MFAWLKAWLLIGRRTREVDFVGSLAVEGVMGPVLVVPLDDQIDLPGEE
jgi:hypothetical protein